MSRPLPTTWTFACGALALAALVASGCHSDMHNQARIEPLEASTFFADGMSARPPVEGTVARDQLVEDGIFLTGRDGDEYAAEIPATVEIDRALLERGQERFEIYCAACHAYTGDGNGMIVQRGFRRPPSFHDERLRNAPAGHFFDVMTNGFGAMPSYSTQVPPADRWAIVAYVRVLQMSQHAELKDVPAEERARLEGGAP